ncbi:MAG TPA: cob(I)yrinic acid a,c-diamide adenosyltransferase [Dehalococcoidia bacterium]|nr:cob(I)yrinic acid a,c-diamide adenosyltransferase [Dehalococcoidia bacterium]
MKTFNKRGDKGETSLLYGVRVPKSAPRCEANGAIDEANSALGLARALSQKRRVQDILLSVQKDLFILSGELATPIEEYPKFTRKNAVITAGMVQRLEDLIDELEKELEMPKDFITPTCASSAAINLARAIVRRAEREVVRLKQEGQLPNDEVLKYLNRLADLVFTLVCYEEKEATNPKL